jgi:hypothetical protein
MNKEESNLHDITLSDKNHLNEQNTQDQHGQSLEDKIEAMLRLSWIMLPESCSIPCNILSLIL